jgi:DNA-directed RNA polymerase I subunit RPA2
MAPSSSSSPSMRSTIKETSASASASSSRTEGIPSFRRGHLPNTQDVIRLRSLTRPHVESFNYFLKTGLERGIKDIEPCEIDMIDPKRLRRIQQQQIDDNDNNNESGDNEKIDWDEITTVRFWMEDVKVVKPSKPSSSGLRNAGKLFPRECRERSMMYSGQVHGKFCYQLVQRRNGVSMPGQPFRLSKTFGNMPIMVGSNACHLHDMTPKQLVHHREEVRYSIFPFSVLSCLFLDRLKEFAERIRHTELLVSC